MLNLIDMNNDHKSEEQLAKELADAAQQVPVGTFYAHYKHPDWEHRYEIKGHVILEASDEVAVLYKSLYMKQEVVFARALSVFQETVEWEGETVPRFIRLEPVSGGI